MRGVVCVRDREAGWGKLGMCQTCDAHRRQPRPAAASTSEYSNGRMPDWKSDSGFIKLMMLIWYSAPATMFLIRKRNHCV